MFKKAASKAAGEEKPQAYPLGYVEDFFRTENAAGDLFQHPVTHVFFWAADTHYEEWGSRRE